MNRIRNQHAGPPVWYLAFVFFLVFAVRSHAMIDGLSGTSFELTAKADHIYTPDGGSPLIWGLAHGSGRAQYPAPTLILQQGDTVTVTLTNQLSVPVSLVFPGHSVTAEEVSAPTAPGLLTLEASPGGAVRYAFTATHAGTYLYHSGTQPELQVEMGIVGAIIVRPYGFNHAVPRAYAHPDSAYDREVLFLLSEMDPRIHETVAFQGAAALQNTDYLSDYFPNYWFINGRSAPDTMASPSTPWLPTQPYNCMPMMYPGEKLLMRIIGGGRDLHPFHYHGNHARIIARNGRLLESTPGAGADLQVVLFTTQSVPGETVDQIFEWTGKDLGWDIYGTAADGPEFVHDCLDGDGDGFDDLTHEYCADHNKPFPVVLPELLDLTIGGFYSGSPFLGSQAALPPGEGGLNPSAGFVYMWHSHTEKEMSNYNIFPGGMMTMLVINPPGAPMH